MEQNKPDQSQPLPGKGNHRNEPGQEERVSHEPPDRSRADDKGTIPELPEPEVEGVGNEGRGNDLDQDPSQP